MQDRINTTIESFNALIQSDEFCAEAGDVVGRGAILLDELSKKTDYSDGQFQEAYDVILAGTVLCCLVRDSDKHPRLHDSEAYLRSCGLKKAYPFTIEDMQNMAGMSRAEYDELNKENKETEDKALAFATLIPLIGKKALIDRSLSLPDFVENSDLGKIFSTVKQDRYDNYKKTISYPMPESHKKLYINAYRDQERSLEIFRYLKMALAGIATFIPPLSLLITVPMIVKSIRANHQLRANYQFTILEKIGIGLSSLLPIFSGIFTYKMIDLSERINRLLDPIQRVTFTSMDEFLAQKSHATKNPYKELYKPKKIVEINQDGSVIALMDRAQLRERFYGRFRFGGEEANRASQQESAAIVDEVERRYQNKR